MFLAGFFILSRLGESVAIFLIAIVLALQKQLKKKKRKKSKDEKSFLSCI